MKQDWQNDGNCWGWVWVLGEAKHHFLCFCGGFRDSYFKKQVWMLYFQRTWVNALLIHHLAGSKLDQLFPSTSTHLLLWLFLFACSKASFTLSLTCFWGKCSGMRCLSQWLIASTHAHCTLDPVIPTALGHQWLRLQVLLLPLVYPVAPVDKSIPCHLVSYSSSDGRKEIFHKEWNGHFSTKGLRRLFLYDQLRKDSLWCCVPPDHLIA